jgi:hypothetical protein
LVKKLPTHFHASGVCFAITERLRNRSKSSPNRLGPCATNASGICDRRLRQAEIAAPSIACLPPRAQPSSTPIASIQRRSNRSVATPTQVVSEPVRQGLLRLGTRLVRKSGDCHQRFVPQFARFVLGSHPGLFLVASVSLAPGGPIHRRAPRHARIFPESRRAWETSSKESM